MPFREDFQLPNNMFWFSSRCRKHIDGMGPFSHTLSEHWHRSVPQTKVCVIDSNTVVQYRPCRRFERDTL